VVFADTPAVVRGTHGGFSGTHALTVVNIFTDNYRLYAADGIADDWQVLHFGEQNPDAAPLLDPDGDGQTNLFESIAGLTPTDPGSRLQLRIEPIVAEPSQRALFFHPVFAGRTYTVHFRDSLTVGDWLPLTGALESTTGETRTVTDLDATVPARFYRVEVSKD
jgi:hypothetical protein